MKRLRLDQLLVERGLAPSRAAAQALLMAGEVELAGAASRNLKPGQLVASDVDLGLVPRPRWASRAGHKLEAALDRFALDPAGLTCLDAGASTGGFTDVLLARGAARVYAVDVGRGQLLDRLRRHPRVVSMEQTNLRTLATLPEPVQLASLDLSFISLRLVLRAVRRLLTDDGRVVALVKPQFEAGRDAVPRGGVVRDPAVRGAVLRAFAADALAAGFGPVDLMASPISGADGNLEFLALLGSPPGVSHGEWDARVDALATTIAQAGRTTMRYAMKKRTAAQNVEQLSVGFEGLEVVEPPVHEPGPDTMRQIVSLRMPDALFERVESVARARGVSPSSLMRALIAAGLDRSYAAVQDDVAGEIAALRRQVAEIAATLGGGDAAVGRARERAGEALDEAVDEAAGGE